MLRASLAGSELGAGFANAATPRIALFCRCDPGDELTTRCGRQAAPLGFRLRHRFERVMEIERNDRIAARSALSFSERRTRALDPPFSRVEPFGGIDPRDEIVTRDRREVVPPGLGRRRSRQRFAKVRRHGGHGYPASFAGLKGILVRLGMWVQWSHAEKPLPRRRSRELELRSGARHGENRSGRSGADRVQRIYGPRISEGSSIRAQKRENRPRRDAQRLGAAETRAKKTLAQT